MKKLIVFFLFLGSISLVINYQVFISYRLQDSILTEFNNNEVLTSTFENIKDRDFFLPNITATTLPLKDLKANYFFRFGEYSKALALLDEKKNDNPNWYYAEFLKSLIFNEIGMQDSSAIYAKIAFTNLPNNIGHFERYAITLAQQKNVSKLNDAFIFLNNNDNLFWKIYLGTLLNIEGHSTKETKDIVIKAVKLHYEDKEIFGMANAILYGQKNIDSSLFISNAAQNLFEKLDYKNAALQFESAINLYPGEFAFYENGALAYHLSNNNTKSLELIKVAMDSFPNQGNGKAEYIKALALLELGQKEEACKSLLISRKLNFKQAYQLVSKHCN